MLNPKNKINTGIASYGMSGRVFHAPLLHICPGFNLKTIVERSPKGSKDIYPYVSVVRSFDDLINDDDLELIIVNTPDTTHFELCKMVLESGKNVVVEKPFTVTVQEAEELINLAEKMGVVMSVFQNRRWDGDYLTAKKVIEDKMLGRLVSFESHFDRYRNFIQPDTWKEQRNQGAEILYNLGAHLIDQVYDLFGMPNGVWAEIGIQRTGGKADDFFNVVMKYAEVQVMVRSSYMVREEGPRYTIHGTEGSFVKYGIDPQEELLKKGVFPDAEGFGSEDPAFYGVLNTNINELHVEGTIETLPGRYLSYYENVHDAITEGKDKLIVKPSQSLDMMNIISACVESNKTGNTIRLK